MAFRLSLICLFSLILFQVYEPTMGRNNISGLNDNMKGNPHSFTRQLATYEGQAKLVRRDAPQEKNASQVIDEAIESLTSGVNDLVKKVQSNELYQNITESIKKFGEAVQKQGEELVTKIKQESKN